VKLSNADLCCARGIMVTGSLTVSVDTDGCRGTGDEVRYVEHVQAVVTIASARRGDLEIYLTSPMGTRSTLLAHRVRDTSTEGLHQLGFHDDPLLGGERHWRVDDGDTQRRQCWYVVICWLCFT
jgi:hypothetical protein